MVYKMLPMLNSTEHKTLYESFKARQCFIFRYFSLYERLKFLKPRALKDHNHNRENPAQFENRIKPRVYARRITRSTMYEKALFC